MADGPSNGRNRGSPLAEGRLLNIGYSYAVNGSFRTGWDAQSFLGDAEAEDFAANIRKQKTVIRFNPTNPERSRIDPEPLFL